MIYFSQGHLGAQYFRPQYLHGGQEEVAKSGVNRLWAIALQEESDRERKAAIKAQVEEKVIKLPKKPAEKPKVVELRPEKKAAPVVPLKPIYNAPRIEHKPSVLFALPGVMLELQIAIIEFNDQANDRFEQDYQYRARLLLLAA